MARVGRLLAAGSPPAALPLCGWDASGRRVGVGRAARLGLGYQTRHRTFGFMGEPFVQWNASAKAPRFCSEPSTLRVDGRGLRQCRPGRGAWGCQGHLPVLQGTVDISLDGLDGELWPVGSAPHLWAHEGRGCGTGEWAGVGCRGKEDQRGCPHLHPNKGLGRRAPLGLWPCGSVVSFL